MDFGLISIGLLVASVLLFIIMFGLESSKTIDSNTANTILRVCGALMGGAVLSFIVAIFRD